MQTAEKTSITLPTDMLRLIREAVDGGEYASTSEALRARAQASLADPAPSLTEAEADARLATLFAAAGADDAAL